MTARPSSAAPIAPTMYSYDKPWKPYRRTPASQRAAGSGSRCASSGMRWWNAVSKHATCGMSHRARVASMPAIAAGMCNGANGTSVAEVGQHVVVDEGGLGVAGPAVHDTVAGGARRRESLIIECGEGGVERARCSRRTPPGAWHGPTGVELRRRPRTAPSSARTSRC